MATAGTATYFTSHQLPVTSIFKVGEGRPHAVDHIKNGAIQLVVNTPSGRMAFHRGSILQTALGR